MADRHGIVVFIVEATNMNTMDQRDVEYNLHTLSNHTLHVVRLTLSQCAKW